MNNHTRNCACDYCGIERGIGRLAIVAKAQAERALEWRRLFLIACALLGLATGVLVWQGSRLRPACAGPLDTKVVPLNPTEIRASRSAPVWL